MNDHKSQNIQLIEPIVDSNNEPVSVDENGDVISYKYDDIWYFDRSPSYTKVTNLSFKSTLQDIKREIQDIMYRVCKSKSELAVSTFTNYLYGFKVIAECLGNCDWEKLDNDIDYKEFKQKLRQKKMSNGRLNNVTKAMSFLFQEGFISRYIKDHQKFKENLSDTEKTTKQHIAFPEDFYTKLINTAISIVDEYYPYRHEINNAYEAYLNALEGYKESHSYSHFNQSKYSKIDHNVNVEGFYLDGYTKCANRIKRACLIVTLAFTGCRISEVKSFNPSGYTEKKYKGLTIPLITGYDTKPNEGGTPKQVTWVTHPIVKKALELAYDMSQYSRKFYTQKYQKILKTAKEPKEIRIAKSNLELCNSSFITNGINNNYIISNHLENSRDLSKFLPEKDLILSEKDVQEFKMLNPDWIDDLGPNNRIPNIRSHSFRRTFAVFASRNKLVNIMALKYQLKHPNIHMSLFYAKNSEIVRHFDLTIDEDIQAMIHESNMDVQTEILYDIYNSDELYGLEGERILQKREEQGYKGQVMVSKEEIRAGLKNGSMSVVEHPTGYCLKPDCDLICNDELSSTTCAHLVITPEKVEAKIDLRLKFINKFRAINNGNIGMKAILDKFALYIEAIEKILTKAGIEYEPFKDEIKAKYS